MLSKRLSTAATTIVVLLLTRSSAHAGIFINEFMASNTTTLQDQDGEFSDWIEIYNSGSAAVNLNGYFLTDTPSVPTAWKFPSTSVPSHGYLIVFASDKNRAVSGSELHTNFKLSASGEYLGLIAPNGTTVVDEYAPAFPAQSPDISYGLAPDLATERCFLHPTPGGPNDVSQACNLVDASSGLVITEFMASNATTLKDQDGEFSDWIEIFNSSASSRNLNGFFLTDDATNRTKWRFPSTVLPSGGYLVVFASSKNRAVSGAQLHTNFKLAAAGQYLALVNPDGVKVAHQYAPAYPPQTSDISWGLTNDRSRQRCFLHPTPGQANDESTPCGNVAPLSVVPARGFYT